jgi:predicted nuclease of restriction endonuclease-like (RecB) superfamily
MTLASVGVLSYSADNGLRTPRHIFASMSNTLIRGSAGEIAMVAGTAAYLDLIDRLKQRIRESQARAARTLNTELVMLYWSIGRDILDQQQAGGWGDDVVGRIAQDLAADTGPARGFSRRNLFYMRRFAALWPEPEKVQTLSAQIGWSHHQVLMDACGDDPDLYAWYATKAAEHRWAVRHLKGQISLRLHERQGSAVTNFAAALQPPDAQHALEAIKDPYVFDFLELAEDARERHLEQALIDDIQRFLLELGTGFAFYGRQRSLLVGEQEFFLDLLFCAPRGANQPRWVRGPPIIERGIPVSNSTKLYAIIQCQPDNAG